MSTVAILRLATRNQPHRTVLRSIQCCPTVARPLIPASVAGGYGGGNTFSTSVRRKADHGEETFEEFSERYEKEFDNVQDCFELQRNLNNAFAYDLVPSPAVITAALRAARRVNDFPTAVRIFEGIKAKVENQHQYEEYLEDLKPLREELGVNLKEDLYPDDPIS
ncbi:MAG: hypothetical protein LQ338_006466 [Usnochroma carphineum]|nr:MAG: hypothetical protein LQ338_006466 [Usnochroma carphineum]